MVWDKNKMKKSIKISNKLWLLLSKHYFVYILMALFVSIALVIFVCLRDDFNVTDVIELSAFSAVVLESILSGVAKIVQKRAANKVEDPSKLTIDYDSLMKIYHNSKNRMIMCSDGTLIPVIIEEWLYDKEIIIDDLYEYEYKLPELVVRYYDQFLSAHDTSNIYNNINIRINDWSTNGNKFIIVTGRTTYYNSLVTNRVMDYKLDNGISIRQLYECGPYVRPISKSVLSNHIGFNGFIESADGYFAFVFRGKNVSIGKRTWANSIGASLKAKYALDDYRFSAQGLENGILCEIKDELKIDRNNLVRIHGQFEKLSAEYANTVYEMQDKIKAFPMKEEQLTTALSNLQADRKALKALPIDPETKLPVFKMKIGDVEYTDKKEAAKALEEAALSIRIADTPIKVGEFQGFPLSITVHSPAMGGGMTATMQGEYQHSAKLISSFAHNMSRIEAGLYNIDRRIDQGQDQSLKAEGGL